MKKIFASLGVVAVGASTIHAAPAGMAMVDPSKPWSVSATLRGFYDDNYTTAPDATARDSFGFTIRPSVALGTELGEQTTVGLRYTYGATWYEDRTSLNSDNNAWDQSHQIEALLAHSFSERADLSLKDSFVVAQEPELLASPSGPFPVLYRTEGNNFRNYGEALFSTVLTRKLSLMLGYKNSFYDYENDNGNALDPSLSGLLDRMEQTALVNLRYQALQQTVLVLGYNYGQVDYNSTEVIAAVPNGTSDIRNNRSHYVYAGFDQNFSKDLLLSVRGGGQWTDYYNQDENTTSPYASIDLTYSYLPGDSFQVGFMHSRNATDLVQPVGNTVTLDQQSSVVYGSIHHRFDAKLSGSIIGQWQRSEFFGGFYDGETESFFSAGLNLTYAFNQHFSGEIGYNYDDLYDSPAGREYSRNRIYLGVTAAY